MLSIVTYVQQLIVVCEVWYCVPGMAINTSSGTERRQPMVYYCWASSPWCSMTRRLSRAKQVHFRGSRLQTGGSCLVVVKLASLGVSCGGNRPPTNATNQCFDWKATRVTRLVYVQLSSLRISVSVCVLKFWSRRGCMKA